MGKKKEIEKTKVKEFFEKKVINAYASYEVKKTETGLIKRPMDYKRPDLHKWAKEAFNRGEDVFYCKPVDPSAPYGKLELSEPVYAYVCKREFTEEEFNSLD